MDNRNGSDKGSDKGNGNGEDNDILAGLAAVGFVFGVGFLIKKALQGQGGQSPQAALQAHFERARQSELKGDLRTAVIEYYECLRIDSQSSAAHNQIAWLLATNQTDVDRAVNHGREAVRLAPNDDGVHDTLAEAYLAKGDLASSWDETQKALSMLKGTDSDSQETRFLCMLRIGRIRLMQQDLPAAIQAFKQAEVIDRTSWPFDITSAYFGLINCYIVLNDHEEVLRYCQKSLAKNAKHVPTLVFAAEASLAMSPPDPVRARGYLQQALALAPKDGWPYLRMAASYALEGNGESVREWYERAIPYFNGEMLTWTKFAPQLGSCRKQALRVVRNAGLITEAEFQGILALPSSVTVTPYGGKLIEGAALANGKRAARVFCSYSHPDERYLKELREALALLRQQGLIEFWYDRDIGAGAHIDATIREKLETADIVLLLVSSAFLNSDYCYGTEMSRALERERQGTARVIPILIRETDWMSAPFGRNNALPPDGKPVDSWLNRDDAWTKVAMGIRQTVEAILPALVR